MKRFKRKKQGGHIVSVISIAVIAATAITWIGIMDMKKK